MKLLDCTLRDGGYYTNWDFFEPLVNEYFKAMDALPIDYVEIGYRSPGMSEYFGEYFYCPIDTMEEAKRLMPNKKLAIILNEKDVDNSQLEFLLGPCKGLIDMIRIAVDPKFLDRAKKLSKDIKKMGFEVAFNVMYMSTWIQNKGFLDGLIDIDQIVDVLYMVDSYGGVYPNEISHLSSEIKKRTSVTLGFHGHNNIEMAFINSLEALNSGCEYIDFTVTGMGRGAGNLKTELFLTYLQSKKGYEVDFFSLAGVAQSFETLQRSYNWGTSLPYMFSGANSLAQKTVMAWIGKNRYTFGEIIHGLKGKSDESSLPPLSELKIDARIGFVIGGGSSFLVHKESILKLIDSYQNEAVLVHAGTKYFKNCKELKTLQICCLVGKEGHRLIQNIDSDPQKFACISANEKQVPNTYVPSRLKSKTYELEEMKIIDNHQDSPLAIALAFANQKSFSKVYLIGFDGYSDRDPSSVSVELATENEQILKMLPTPLKEKMISLTPTRYNNLKTESLYHHLCLIEK